MVSFKMGDCTPGYIRLQLAGNPFFSYSLNCQLTGDLVKIWMNSGILAPKGDMVPILGV